jgi:hypothetical protein
VRRLAALPGALLWLLAALLVAPAAAQASREPRPSERAAIVRAARRTEAAPGVKVRVADVRVSTAGPWAVATVTLVYPASSQEQEEHFRRAGARWIDTQREMPLADQRSLGLAKSAFWRDFEIYLLVGWALALACVVDVLRQPRRAFAATGRSKLRWLLIELLGGVLLGVFTWGWYAFAVRPGLVRAGGARRWLVLAPLRFLAALASPGQHTPDGRKPPPKAYTPAPADAPREASRERCPHCHGTTQRSCHGCGGSGVAVWANHAGDTPVAEKLCSNCGGRGWYPCSCAGGYVA